MAQRLAARPLWIEWLAGIDRHDTRVSAVPKKFTPLGAKLFHELAATVATNDNDPKRNKRKWKREPDPRKPRNDFNIQEEACTEA